MKYSYEHDNINISLPAVEWNRLMRHMRDILEAHFKLVILFKEEDALKKHHRAYLHVREQMSKLIDETTPLLQGIQDDLTAFLKSISPEDLIEEETVECGDCPCCECNGDCDACGFVPPCGYADEDEEDEPPFEVEEEYPFEEAETPAISSGYLFKDDDIVCLTKKDFDTMLDDVLTLAELVTMVTEMRREDIERIRKYARFIPAFADFERDRLEIYKDARFEADEIVDRWDDANFGELHSMTVELT